jgi:hypothetical protein
MRARRRSGITNIMPRSAAQSDFAVVTSDPERALQLIELPPAAGPVMLPRAELRSHEASAGATRWVLRATVLLLVALFALCAVALHLPPGG